MRKHIEVIICDRCGCEFETKGRKTMLLGIMYLENGGGSRHNATDRDLDKDLCPLCTEAFKRFWTLKKDV